MKNKKKKMANSSALAAAAVAGFALGKMWSDHQSETTMDKVMDFVNDVSDMMSGKT